MQLQMRRSFLQVIKKKRPESLRPSSNWSLEPFVIFQKSSSTANLSKRSFCCDMQITLLCTQMGRSTATFKCSAKLQSFNRWKIAAETVLISHSITMRCDLTHIQSTIQTYHHHQRFELFFCMSTL